ncbi:MAG: Lnb N-terminal periplasmic domain-containing protein [Panacagrimonas sp.]
MSPGRQLAGAAAFFLRACSWLLALACLAAGFSAAAADPGYLDELQASARERGLAGTPAWQRLLHANPGVLGRKESTLDFRGFFLSAEGKSDPQSELDATLATFFDDSLLYEEPRQCRFKARYEWLKAQLGFDAARLPEADCARLREWLEAIDASALTLVFASNDLDGPSTTFGHTLLRLDAGGAAGDQRLLAYAVNYAAQTTREAGMLYAVKGLTGFYQGTFSVMPYYEKVREYERFEHRDLWEYPLLLDDAARQRLMWHLWELRGVNSDYFFFGENCSYQLLSLIESAAPQMDLTSSFRSGPDYTIPIDSVRALRNVGVLGEPAFRPANAHRLKHRFSELSDSGRTWVQAYVAGKAGLEDAAFIELPAAEQARRLEVAHDALYFRYQKRETGRSASLPRARELLAARSRNPAVSDFSDVPRPPISPDQGHGSGRIGLGLRALEDEDTAALLSWRPAYHDHLDPPQGFLAGGEIEFLGIELAVNDEHIRLDHARLLNVQAVAPRDELFKPWSWFATLDAVRARPLAERPGSLGGAFTGGGGAAWTPFTGSQLFAFATTRVEANSDLGRGHDLGAGAKLGLAVQRFTPLTLELSGEALEGLAGADTDRARLDATMQWSFGVANGLRLGYRIDHRRDDDFRERDTAVELRWLHYF